MDKRIVLVAVIVVAVIIGVAAMIMMLQGQKTAVKTETPAPFCGDNTCNSDENCKTCQIDCNCSSDETCMVGFEYEEIVDYMDSKGCINTDTAWEKINTSRLLTLAGGVNTAPNTPGSPPSNGDETPQSSASNAATTGPTEINVTVLGVPSQAVAETLYGTEAKLRDINYAINLLPTYVPGELLKNYQVVILQGDPSFDLHTRAAVTEYVKDGGRMIVVGDAGVRSPYPNVAGWEWPSGDIPVPAKILGEFVGFIDVAYGSELTWINTTHPIAVGLTPADATMDTPTQIVGVTSKGQVVASVEAIGSAMPAIIEGNTGAGKVIYFAYDPGQTPKIFLAAIEYLVG